jgi:myo-inositol 2-dehydrogenase/D-chiro-inositol 1-dehydrogenase
MLGFAVIGFGAWGSFHAQTVSRTEGAQLRAIVSSSSEGVSRARPLYPAVTCTTDLEGTLARGDIDAVCIVTPNASHEALAVAAFAAGKHVVLEKPMALDRASCARINAAARAAGRTLHIVHELRMSAQYGEIKQWIAEGRLGDPLCLHFTLFRRSFRSGTAGWRYQLDEVGSWLLEELVHYVDLAAWYFDTLGPPVTVSATGNARGGAKGLYDNFTLCLHWQGGAYAVLSQSLAGFEHHKNLEIVGTRGSARACWSGVMDRTDAPSASLFRLDGLRGDERFDVGTPTRIDLDMDKGEVAHLEEFMAAVVAGIGCGTPAVSGADGARAVMLCEAAQRSALTGQTVSVDADATP